MLMSCSQARIAMHCNRRSVGSFHPALSCADLHHVKKIRASSWPDTLHSANNPLRSYAQPEPWDFNVRPLG